MNVKMRFVLMIMMTVILASCSSNPVIEVTKPTDSGLSCRQLRSELYQAKAYLSEMNKKAGVQQSFQRGAGNTQTIFHGATAFIPIPIIGPIITTVLSLFQSNISPQKALQAARSAEARIRHIDSLNKIKNCKALN